jgi:hypothetical protein
LGNGGQWFDWFDCLSMGGYMRGGVRANAGRISAGKLSFTAITLMLQKWVEEVQN